MTQLSSFTQMKAHNLQIHIRHFLCSGPSTSQSLGLLGHTFLNLTIHSSLHTLLTSMVLLTNLSIILLTEWLFSANIVLSLTLQETVNAGH